MNYFDLHCDTPFEICRHSTMLDDNNHHVSLKRTEAAFGHYAQLAAYCSPRKLSDEEGFWLYVKTTAYLFNEIYRLSDRAMICRSFSELEQAEHDGKAAIFPTVEDARIASGDIYRLDYLYRNGCRFLTLVWGGNSCVGGAHNTSEGLTDFGKAVARHCFEIGIVPDISHSSEQTVDDLISIAEEEGKPFIASHSNSYEVFSHSRNLRDRHFEKLVKSGGIVGLSLCDCHIQPASMGHPGIDGVIRHIEHYLELGGENAVAFGCDFDGCDLPDGMVDISDIHKVPDRMAQLGYSDELIGKLCYENARNFIKRNF